MPQVRRAIHNRDLARRFGEGKTLRFADADWPQGGTLLLLALGRASMAFVLIAQDRIEQAFARDLAGIDAVVRAKGSPLRLILAGVCHLDLAPTKWRGRC